MSCGVRLFIYLGVIFLSTSEVLCASWDTEPFKEIPAEYLTWKDYVPGSGQVIELEEEVKEEVKLAKINYKGPGLLTYRLSQNGAELGFELKKNATDEDYMYIYITEKLDYDNNPNPTYTITIYIDEGSVKYQDVIYVVLINIDDNPPSIKTAPCDVEELFSGVTNCTYEVYDLDGPISIDAMTFELVVSPSDIEQFDLKIDRPTPPPNNYKTMKITVVTRRDLDYSKSQLHMFDIIARDSADNEGEATAIIKVIDMPNMPPVWVTIFATQTFDEKTPVTFTVIALDGDTGINTKINYRLEKDYTDPVIEIDKETGVITVPGIDRDALEEELFPFDIVAYKANNESSFVSFSTVFIVKDVNDQTPVNNLKIFTLEIEEEKFIPIEFKPPITFHDRDLGDNARYTVKIVSAKPPKAEEAFIIIPASGYQEQQFQLIIVNAKLLDFDDKPWQNIELTINATETNEPSHVNTTLVKIDLLNWNDELPIFSKPIYTAELYETNGTGTFVVEVEATDRDIDDVLTYSLEETVDYLSIDKSGKIKVIKDDVFDFDRQTEIVVQVKVEDFLPPETHIAYSRLIIKILDVNNKPPEIRMPITTPTVEENKAKGVEFPEKYDIIGRDVDTTARIEFSIDWKESYAIKQGIRTNAEEYENCLDLKTIYKDKNKTGNAVGRFVVKEIREGVTIDFEEFEVLYLKILLKDFNTEVGLDTTSAFLTVMIEDLNDNKPMWTDNTATAEYFVRELSDEGVLIASVVAIDIDGPEFNQVSYKIKEKDPDTPKGMVSIVDKKIGKITVTGSPKISADDPDTYYLYYIITATDCKNDTEEPGKDCWESPLEIKIFIIDTNNQEPQTTQSENDLIICIEEHYKSEDDFFILKVIDKDRDVPYKTVSTFIDRKFTNLHMFEMINETRSLNVIKPDDLDRDYGVTFYDVYIDMIDNFQAEGDRIQNKRNAIVRIYLLDINDNAPKIPDDFFFKWNVNEDAKKGTLLEQMILATDIDFGDNATVDFKILSIVPTTDNPNPNTEGIQDLFKINTPKDNAGQIETTGLLKFYWGSYNITIEARDRGTPENMFTDRTYLLTVDPYNYNEPKFIFPKNGDIIKLNKGQAAVGALNYVNGTALEMISALDEDGLEAGVVYFDIQNSPAKDFLTVTTLPGNKGQLALKKYDDSLPADLQVRMIAQDKGIIPEPRSETIEFTLKFISTDGYPYFVEKTFVTDFTEGQTGMGQSQEIEVEVRDDKNDACGDTGGNCWGLYYFIREGNTKDFFNLDKENKTLSLKKPLNRDEGLTHELTIIVTNDVNDNVPPGTDSRIDVTIKVREENPKPRFDKKLYTFGISTNNEPGSNLFTVKAVHSEEKKITYELLEDTMEANSSLDGVKDNAFKLDAVTGSIFLNFQPLGSMSGMFEFNISATDPDNGKDIAETKIFIISSENTVPFIFKNQIADVEKERDFLLTTFTEFFGYDCVIDSIGPATYEENGTTIDNHASVKTHFMRNGLAVSRKVIEAMQDDIPLVTGLRKKLLENDLLLQDFGSSQENVTESLQKMIQIILIVVSSVLGVLCIVLILTFCLKIKRLNHRLEALSVTKFGSQDSGLNRVGVSVPGTNKHALEGSNPVWNEDANAPDFDAMSDISGDSDLIGIEDEPQFAYENAANNRRKSGVANRRVTKNNLHEHGA